MVQMSAELTDLLDTALYREIASQALYTAAQDKTDDPGARALMKELAAEELKHSQSIKRLRQEGVAKEGWHREKVPDLMISEYLTGPDTIEGAGLQETLVFAMKREQQSLEFYSKMMSIMRGKAAKTLCQRLAQQELKHKLRLETLYDDLFYSED